MDFQVGEDDLTADKDPKHVFKRGRNRLLRMLGMKVFGVQITPAIIRAHLQHAGHSLQHINADLCPDDKQDVKQAYELLKDIWSFPGTRRLESWLHFRTTRLRIIGSLFYHLLFPYICKDALPTLLFTDIMIMIKNVYFSVAKAKKDDPEGRFWLILLGTDRLEELFGILRTMIGTTAISTSSSSLSASLFILKKDLDPDDNGTTTKKWSLPQILSPEFTKFITVHDKPLRKTRVLSLMQKYGYKAGSTDRLKRVADVQRYSAKLQESSTIIDRNPRTSSYPSPSRRFLIPAATEDDPDSKHDWRSSGVLRDVLTSMVAWCSPWILLYRLVSSASLIISLKAAYSVLLVLNSWTNFPYREASGFACFVCEGDNQIDGLEETDSHSCLKCKPPHALNINKPQTVLMHMGTHILYDSTIHASDQPCGFFAKHKDLWELSESEKVAMQNIWKKLKEPSKKATRKKKPQTTLKISAAHSSRRALVVEGPEQSDHSDAPDASDDDSFMNLDSPIPSPKAPQDYDSELELPTAIVAVRPGTEDLADHDEQENGSSAPATMPDAVSSAPTSSAPPGITVTPNLGAEPTARRSGRKRKEREELKDLSAALSACICGSSAAPLDSSEHPNVVSGEGKRP
ncbi:hypothetical protein B0H10DRAFT_2242107 [Mycena sp. CBHHK59/15]|nr:hypothetical protein B0H10DRAFT_2242107 [Mycena sp. CBHHK59/15]